MKDVTQGELIELDIRVDVRRLADGRRRVTATRGSDYVPLLIAYSDSAAGCIEKIARVAPDLVAAMPTREEVQDADAELWRAHLRGGEASDGE